MTDFNGTVAIAIEGIGVSTSASYSKGAALYHGQAPADGFGSYEWIPALIERPDGIEALTEPILGRSKVSSFTFRLRRTDDLAKRLLYKQFRAPNLVVGALSSSATSIILSGETRSAGDVVWIEDEAIRLGTYSAPSFTGCTRGFWRTQAAAHEGASFVYSKQNYVRFRKVSLLVIDTGGSIEEIWSGYIDSAGTNGNGTQILLQCRESQASIQGATINKAAPNLAPFAGPGFGIKAPIPDGNGEYSSMVMSGVINVRDVYWAGRSDRWASRVRKTGEANTSTVAVQVAGGLTVAEVSGFDWVFGDISKAYLGSSFEIDEDTRARTSAQLGAGSGGLSQAQMYDVERLTAEGKIFEVAVVSREMDRILTAAGADPISFTANLAYPYHPLSVVAALWLSTESSTEDLLGYDTLNGRFWSANIIHYAASTILNDIPDIIAATREVEIDQLVLGWDGEEVDAWRIGLEILRSFGLFLTNDTSGEFSFERLKAASVDEYDAALSNKVKVRRSPGGQPLLQWESAYEETYETFVARVGDLPWQDPVDVTVQVSGTSNRSQSLMTSKSLRYDFQTISAGNAGSLREVLQNTGVLLHSSMPRLSVWVESPDIGSLDYTTGSNITFDTLPIRRSGDELPWLVGSDGELTTTQDGIEFIGKIVGRQFDIGSRSYRLRVLLTNHALGTFARWRAPAMEVTSWTDNGDGTYDLGCAAASQFGYEDSDAEAFYVGDEIELWERNGTRDVTSGVTGAWSVTAVAAQTLTTSSGPTSDPTGSFVRVAELDLYSNDTIFTNIDRAWAYIGDSDFTVGTADEEADTYG